MNYDKYTTDQYDRDIVDSIPHHKELHNHIADFIKSHFDASKEYDILDLGTGTGITAKLIQGLLPKVMIDAVDFSEQMIIGAKNQKRKEKNLVQEKINKLDIMKRDIILIPMKINLQKLLMKYLVRRI